MCTTLGNASHISGANSQLPCRGYNVPVHGEYTIADSTSDRVECNPLRNHQFTSLAPANPRTMRGPTSSLPPGGVGSLQQLINWLARYVAVNKYLGQTLGQLRGWFRINGIPSQCLCLRAIGIY